MLHWSAWLLIAIYFFLGLFPSIYLKIKGDREDDRK